MSRSPRQESLSDPVNSSELTITDVLTHAKPQTKQQATFQRLIRQIDEQRAQVAEWHTYSERYGQRVGSELMPLFAQLREKRIAMLHLLDTQFHQRNVIRGKQQRAKLCDIILNLAHELLLEQRDEEIVALYDKYSDPSYDDQAGIDKTISQDVIEELFGVRLDDDNADVSMEEMLAKAMRQRQEEEAKIKPDQAHAAVNQPNRRPLRRNVRQQKRNQPVRA